MAIGPETIGVVTKAGLLTGGLLGLLFAALHDVAFRTIPNWTSTALFAVGVSLHAMDGTLAGALLASATVLAGAWLCWWRGWLGGGDVKLLAASAALVPQGMAPSLLLDVALAGGLLGLLYLALGKRLAVRGASAPPGRPRGMLGRIWRAERHRIRRQGPLPYASAIATGAAFVLLKG